MLVQNDEKLQSSPFCSFVCRDYDWTPEYLVLLIAWLSCMKNLNNNRLLLEDGAPGSRMFIILLHTDRVIYSGPHGHIIHFGYKRYINLHPCCIDLPLISVFLYYLLYPRKNIVCMSSEFQSDLCSIYDCVV